MLSQKTEEHLKYEILAAQTAILDAESEAIEAQLDLDDLADVPCVLTFKRCTLSIAEWERDIAWCELDISERQLELEHRDRSYCPSGMTAVDWIGGRHVDAEQKVDDAKRKVDDAEQKAIEVNARDDWNVYARTHMGVPRT